MAQTCTKMLIARRIKKYTRDGLFWLMEVTKVVSLVVKLISSLSRTHIYHTSIYTESLGRCDVPHLPLFTLSSTLVDRCMISTFGFGRVFSWEFDFVPRQFPADNVSCQRRPFAKSAQRGLVGHWPWLSWRGGPVVGTGTTRRHLQETDETKPRPRKFKHSSVCNGANKIFFAKLSRKQVGVSNPK